MVSRCWIWLLGKYLSSKVQQKFYWAGFNILLATGSISSDHLSSSDVIGSKVYEISGNDIVSIGNKEHFLLVKLFQKVKSAYTPIVAHQAGTFPGFCSMKWLGVFLLPLDGMLVHCWSPPLQFVRFPRQFARRHPFTFLGGERHCESYVKEHYTVSLARAQTRTTRFVDENATTSNLTWHIINAWSYESWRN